MIIHDGFESDVNRAINRDKRLERERFISKTIASYFKDEYKLDVEVARIVSADKSDVDRGLLTIAIDAIDDDIQVPYRIEEGDLIIESDAFENKLGLKKFKVNVSGTVFDTKALNVTHASEKLARTILKEYPAVNLDGRRYDEKNEKILAKEIKERIVETYNKEKEEGEDVSTSEVPSIVVEKNVEPDPISHILPNISVDSDFSDTVKKERQYKKLIDLTSTKISQILSDISENLSLDEVHIDAIERDEEDENKGVIMGTTRILDKDFSVSLKYTASIDGDEVEVSGLFDLIKGYYGIKGYRIPLGENVYTVEAVSKKEGVTKILNHLISDGEDYSYDGHRVTPENIEFVSTVIANENDSEIEEIKSYDQGMVNEDKRWEVSEDKGDVYLRKLFEAKKG